MKKIICLLAVFFISSNVLFAEEVFAEEEAEYIGEMHISGEFLNGDLLRISVNASDFLEPVLGIAFNLGFENEKLAFLKYEPGEFLERGGDPFYLVTEKSGKLIFGETLRRDDSFPVGQGVIADFYFQILEEGEFSFAYTNGVISTLDVVRQDLYPILWEDKVVGREDMELLVLDGQSSLFNVETSALSRYFPLISIGLGVVAAFFMYFFWKKHEKNRQESSVN